ncbi:hypothetical protein Z957_09540 [Clostridium sp. K25]|uniref:hypothetical protein n=1 Tax=Clostridium sp. K25 TaxID=1443109 RepID=UPI0004D63AE3|nr:hypothetical protein [Clostridium sp. K25]KEI07161.1 hypothetical protein Z957_09540 [Clostridium sp. K25]
MGRKSDYEKGKTEPKAIKVCPEVVKTKMGKEPLTIKEIKVYLNKYSICGKEYTEKTIKNYIEAICQDSNGLLKVSDFKENPKNVKSKYLIKPEVQGLLMLILDSEYFDGRRNERLLKNRYELFRSLIKNIEFYLNKGDQEIIKTNPAYINALLESNLSERLNKELTNLLRSLYHSDPIVRFTMMKYVIEELVRLEKWISKENCAIWSSKLVYGHEVNIGEDGEYQKVIFQSDTLEEYIINLLSHRVHKLQYTEIEEDEILSYPALYLAQKMYNIQIKNESDVKCQLDEIDTAISNLERYKTVMEKAKKILDLNSPYESLIYETLKKLCKVYFMTPYVSPKDYERTVKFTESAIANDMWDILNAFCQSGRHGYTEE